MTRTGLLMAANSSSEGRNTFEKGLTGHSDADVLCHAIIDSLIGALGRGDIGKHFPDTELEWKGASSIALLKNVIEMVNHDGFEVLWIDSTIIAENQGSRHTLIP